MLTCDCGTTDYVHDTGCISLDDDYDTDDDMYAEVLAEDGYRPAPRIPRPVSASLPAAA